MPAIREPGQVVPGCGSGQEAPINQAVCGLLALRETAKRETIELCKEKEQPDGIV